MFLKTVRFLRTWVTNDAPWIALAVNRSILYAQVAARQLTQWVRVDKSFSQRRDQRHLFGQTKPDDAPWITKAVKDSILYQSVATNQQNQWFRVGPNISAKYANRFLFRLTRPDDAPWITLAVQNSILYQGVANSQQAQWARTYPRVNPVYNRYYAQTVFDNAWIFSATTPPAPGAAAVERTRSIYRGLRRGELQGIG